MAFTMNIQLIYLLRLLGAALCGAMIGYERESHMKMAGIRTHAIVALSLIHILPACFARRILAE